MDIQKYQEQQLVQQLISPEATAADQVDSSPSLIVPIIRRWYVVLITFLLVCGIGIPAVWFLVKPLSEATAAIRVAPVIQSILFSDKDSEGVIPMYKNFMNTHADLIVSEQVLQRTADDLVDKNLAFFKKPGTTERLKNKLIGQDDVEPVALLKQALTDGDISVVPGRESELIKISMKGDNPAEMVQIVNAIVKAYMAIVVSEETRGGDQKLTVLESERNVLADKLEKQHQTIRQMAEEYGTVALTSRQEMMLQRVASLQAELTRIQTRRITLEAQLQLREGTSEQGIEPEKLLKLQHEFINADQTIQALTQNIIQLDQGLLFAKQTLAPTNPELKQKADLLDALKARIEERTVEVGKNFDSMMAEELAKSRKDQLANAKTELAQTADYEKRLQDILTKENAETIELGRKQLAIQDQQEQLNITKELYDTIRRRIQELEMERKRPARISVAYNANVAPVPSKRIKFTAALVFGSLAFGVLLALMIDKADHSLRTPGDLTKRIGVRIIGTTVNADYLDKPQLPQQIDNDYQTILANLGLMNGGAIPNKLVITSAGMCEGKTTFAINLATSLARSGKKVVLIDGDLRKPDIGHLLNLPKGSRGLQDLLWGKNLENVVCPFPSSGFDVLTADSRNMSDALGLLSLPHVGKVLDDVSAKYDHVIIDTPPVLAFADALVWAKMADGVILTSFAGHTEERDLKETLNRLSQIKVKVLGTILHNVRTGSSYNRYGYGYYSQKASAKEGRRRNSRSMLLLPAQKDNKENT